MSSDNKQGSPVNGQTVTYPVNQPALHQPKINFGRSVSYGIANLGYGGFYALNNFILSLYLKKFTKNNVIIGLGGSTHSFEGAIIQPLIGTASDRLRSKWGRRRPFMLVGVPISVLFLMLTPLAAHLSEHYRLAAMVACIFLFTITFNIAQDPYNALLPDITPEEQRGTVTGISMFIFLVGQAVLLLLPAKIGSFSITSETKFILCGLLMLVTTAITCLLVKEPEHPAEVKVSAPPLKSIATALQGLKTLHQARKALSVSFLSGMGIGAVFPFLTLFVVKITGCTDNQAEMMALYLIASTTICVLPFGKLVDKIGPRGVLLIALICIAIASALGMVVNTLGQITLVMIFAGVGNGAQFAAAYPLLYQLVPAEEVGFYTGLQSTALSIATPITSIVTGVLVNRGGYRAIFVVCSVFVVGAIFALLTVKRGVAPSEITAREEYLREQAQLTLASDSK